MHSDYLSHHGVKGMKWGVRKKSSVTGNIKKNAKYVKNELTPSSQQNKQKLKRTIKSAAITAGKVYAAQFLKNHTELDWAIAGVLTKGGPARGRIGRQAELSDKITKGKDYALTFAQGVAVVEGLTDIYRINYVDK